jgi:hypothetical protein
MDGRFAGPNSDEGIYIAMLQLRVGRAIAQAVSLRFLNAAALVRARVRSCGIYGGYSGTGASFLRVLRFPLPVRISPTAPQS